MKQGNTWRMRQVEEQLRLLPISNAAVISKNSDGLMIVIFSRLQQNVSSLPFSKHTADMSSEGVAVTTSVSCKY